MSRPALWEAIGRATTDAQFRSGFIGESPAAAAALLTENGYTLEPAEIESFTNALAAPALQPSPTADDVQFQRDTMHRATELQLKRLAELSEYTVNILKQTLGRAAGAARTITWMNVVMFATGIGLFIFAAIYGAVSHSKGYTLILGGLGAANFVVLFMSNPIERTQAALSNLVQVEVAFMNFFEQIAFWENYAQIPKGMPPMPSPENIAEASAQLQLRSRETVEILQKYVEVPSAEKQSRKAAKKITGAVTTAAP